MNESVVPPVYLVFTLDNGPVLRYTLALAAVFTPKAVAERVNVQAAYFPPFK